MSFPTVAVNWGLRNGAELIGIFGLKEGSLKSRLIEVVCMFMGILRATEKNAEKVISHRKALKE